MKTGTKIRYNKFRRHWRRGKIGARGSGTDSLCIFHGGDYMVITVAIPFWGG
ncbi:unnamed protein product [Effrenium voratum]|nr:unnamed protein product [Effrenium voratum]